MHSKVRDALGEFDEATLPPAFQKGDSLLHVRGGQPAKYQALAPFRRVQISRVRDLSDVSLPRLGANPTQTEKIKMLSDLLARLERMVDSSPSKG